MPKSFSRKELSAQITLFRGDFGSEGNTKVLRNLAMEVTVTKPGLPELPKAEVTIYNLKRETMEQVTSLAWVPLETQRNTILISAGDEYGTSVAFGGEISFAHANFNTAPDITMNISAVTGIYPQQKALPPISVNGEVPAGTLISQFVAEMPGYSFTNQGVTTSVRNAVFDGDPLTKCRKVASQIGADLIVDDFNIILLPKNTGRQGGNVLLSPTSGMINYPVLTQDGVAVKCFYNPSILVGSYVTIADSVVPKTNGNWRVVALKHRLVSYKVGSGEWSTEIETSYA